MFFTKLFDTIFYKSNTFSNILFSPKSWSIGFETDDTVYYIVSYTSIPNDVSTLLMVFVIGSMYTRI